MQSINLLLQNESHCTNIIPNYIVSSYFVKSHIKKLFQLKLYVLMRYIFVMLHTSMVCE
jgi:hypothetical protein